MKKVVVGMSGGVDSSVAALLLKRQGYEVMGLFMKNWEETDRRGLCKSAKDYEDALRVCDLIDIPLYTVNFTQQYWDKVFTHFLDELRLGYTPNPDILCNKEIKFSVFFDKAKQLGADYLATGHYCQLTEKRLTKGKDPSKDQSYFLYAVDRSVFSKVLFPIGHLHKAEVREMARKENLPVATKKDSTGICFIGKRNFKEFIRQYIPYHPGNFENLDGKVIGTHHGAAYYTLGQRKGLGIGGPGEAWFVVAKDTERNVVVIQQGSDHPALYSQGLVATESNFIPPHLPFTCKAKTRYRQEDQDCVIESAIDGQLTVRFTKPQRAVTPRQAIVFYQDQFCLGGALIESALS